MTFKKWINRFVDENSHIGDFAGEVSADEDFPQTNDCAKALKYLTDKSVDQFHIHTFKKAWERYVDYIFSDSED